MGFRLKLRNLEAVTSLVRQTSLSDLSKSVPKGREKTSSLALALKLVLETVLITDSGS